MTDACACIPIMWKRRGNVHWDDWWFESEGPVRSHVPNLDNHISFANFDLARYCPGAAIRRRQDGLSLDIDDPFVKDASSSFPASAT